MSLLNPYYLYARQLVSLRVSREGMARCLSCGTFDAVKMFLTPNDPLGFYVRCQVCLIFYPYVQGNTTVEELTTPRE